MEATDAEKDVDFLGFVVLENRLKPESAPVIKELQVSTKGSLLFKFDVIYREILAQNKNIKLIGAISLVTNEQTDIDRKVSH